MKNQTIFSIFVGLLIGLAIGFLIFKNSCGAPKLCFEIADKESAINDVRRFIKMNPDCDSIYHEVYAVFLPKDSIDLHLDPTPWNFLRSQVNADTVTGIRIYEALSYEGKPINYVVYTRGEFRATDTSPEIQPGDIMNKIYLIKNWKYDLREFKENKRSKKILTGHRACEPRCPEESIYELAKP